MEHPLVVLFCAVAVLLGLKLVKAVLFRFLLLAGVAAYVLYLLASRCPAV